VGTDFYRSLFLLQLVQIESEIPLIK
jgi:hypothetical protein